MKRYFFLVSIFVMLIMSSALKSQIFVGGNLNLGLNSFNGGSSSDVNISPIVGYRLSDILAAGGKISISQDKTKNNNGDVSSKTSAFGLGAFARYYLSGSDTKVRLYGQGSADLIFSKSVFGTAETNSTAFGLGVRPAIEVGVTEKIKLDVMFGSAGLMLEFDGGGNQVYLNLNQLSFGLIYEL